ncbi:MAG: nucleoside hydrolase, partial [Acetobacteraceae bacterium]|nr:nucleoside hydrolase [Acetobacteraceae bacterium]
MPIPVIIDCDPGTDDALALLLAFASPELEVRAVTVVAGNVGLEWTVANARGVVALAGASVPVFAGADRPLLGRFPTAAHVHGDDGIGGVALPAGAPAAPGIAADAIRDVLRAAAEPVTVVGIGPATNLALALLTERALAAKVARFVLMSGAWGEGNMTPAAEFNALCDPEALAAVLALRRPVVLVTLDLTAQALATRARLDALRAAGTGRALRAACDIQASVPLSRRFVDGAPLHDPCAVAWLVRPDLFTGRPARVEVECAGASRGRTN